MSPAVALDAPTTAAPELSDDELEAVVGGLARAWDLPASAAPQQPS